jgi:glutamate dehydrogenase
MKAQRVKNAVIVPTGAKGGFYPKLLPSPATDRDAWFAEGTESYRIFIRTLLSVTDNIVAGKVVHPDQRRDPRRRGPLFRRRRRQGHRDLLRRRQCHRDRSQLLAGRRLRRAARTATTTRRWRSPPRAPGSRSSRHFLEMGTDVQSEPVRVAGCGDMSGDVFGNGMLLSKAIKLVAAFDHRHIFLDPDPDPAKSWDERNRMFALPRSSWADYNPT